MRGQVLTRADASRVGRFRIQPSLSVVRFDAEATGHMVHGVGRNVSGEIVFDPENLSQGAEVSFEVDAGSLETGNRIRDRKMRESLLETATYPAIVFRSAKIEAIAPTLRPGETQELTVQGILSLHGVDRPIAFPVKAARREDQVRVTGETMLRLTDFAIPIPRFLFIKLRDEVKVMFEVVAVAEPPRPGA